MANRKAANKKRAPGRNPPGDGAKLVLRREAGIFPVTGNDGVIGEAFTRYQANMYLLAFVLDKKNPRHIIDAYLLYRKRNLPISEAMLKNLDHALEQMRGPPRGKIKENAVRDIHILRSVLLHYSTKEIPGDIESAWIPANEIPDKIDDQVCSALAKQYGMKKGAVKMVISRLRTTLKRQSSKDLLSSIWKPVGNNKP